MSQRPFAIALQTTTCGAERAVTKPPDPLPTGIIGALRARRGRYRQIGIVVIAFGVLQS